MKNIFRKTLMSFGIIAILFVFNTAADAEEISQHNNCDCPDFEFDAQGDAPGSLTLSVQQAKFRSSLHLRICLSSMMIRNILITASTVSILSGRE